MIKFSHSDINNLLYSALRSKKHLRIRRKSYFKRALKLIYLYLTVSADKYPTNKKIILNYLNKSYIDFSDIRLKEDFKFDLKESQVKPLFIVEFLLIISFLLNVQFIHKILFNAAARITINVIKTRNIQSVICGHPDLLISFMGFCLKECQKEVITIQHGIYNLTSYEVLWWEKEVATKIILYGEDFKDLYISQGVRREKIFIGNPYFGSIINPIDNKNVNLLFRNKKVIFLGQQLYKISDSVYEGYNDFLNNFILFFEHMNVEVFYKPHPREELNKSLSPSNFSKLKIFRGKGKPKELYSDFDFYYSVNSSILIELYLQRKICFQVDIPIDDFNYDIFKDYTGIPLVNINNLQEHLHSKEYSFFYDPSYLNIRQDYNKYMVDLIYRIINPARIN
ncbi:hypothetical protein FK178_01780 [Antarcticibacterium arcticum]|uniref:Uncharacterized protein n=1 Tax=Antarcticibacterium arcticum TaxID=2585771 RepID=A0A5B8YLC3_9FLAO|nr:hypothetical protein [Antarcticibacterium arcticum]QED36519.1 hypothetical protein FK178_01780 [Antarcticibacterium arcticum]